MRKLINILFRRHNDTNYYCAVEKLSEIRIKLAFDEFQMYQPMTRKEMKVIYITELHS